MNYRDNHVRSSKKSKYNKKIIEKFNNRTKRISYLFFGRPYRAAETTKARERRQKENFFEKYCQGKGLDIGYGGDLLSKNCQGWDFEHGDAQYLRGIKYETFDYVYSSHTLEHLVNVETAIKNWWRVLKSGGYLILYVPHRDLYERKKTLPSRRNDDHKHFFLIERDEYPDTIGIIPLIKRTLSNYKIIYVKKCTEGCIIKNPIYGNREYSIEAVIKKL